MDRLRNGSIHVSPDSPATYGSCREPFKEALRRLGVNPEGYGLHSGKVGGVIALRDGGATWRSLSNFVGWSPNSVMPERYAKGACKRVSELEMKLAF